jgi:hypothetical protein
MHDLDYSKILFKNNKRKNPTELAGFLPPLHQLFCDWHYISYYTRLFWNDRTMDFGTMDVLDVFPIVQSFLIVYRSSYAV